MTTTTEEIEKDNEKGKAACWALVQYVRRSEAFFRHACREGYSSALLEDYGRILRLEEQTIAEHPPIAGAVECAHHMLIQQMIDLAVERAQNPLTAAILRNDPTYRFWEDRKVEIIDEEEA